MKYYKVKEIHKAIAILKKQMKHAQANCLHKECIKTLRREVDEFGLTDHYYNECQCLNCEKRWEEPQ